MPTPHDRPCLHEWLQIFAWEGSMPTATYTLPAAQPNDSTSTRMMTSTSTGAAIDSGDQEQNAHDRQVSRKNPTTRRRLHTNNAKKSRDGDPKRKEKRDRNRNPNGRTSQPASQEGLEIALLEPWPPGVLRVDHNILDTSRPLPTTCGISENAGLSCGCVNQCVDSANPAATTCINARSCVVCTNMNCVNGPSCGNRFIENENLLLVRTMVGFGVIADETIAQGSFVAEYVGELVYADEADARDNKQYQVALATQTELGERLVIDAEACGNISRFLNHSCAPNCAMYEWQWMNTTRLGIYALRDIAALEELTFSYRADLKLSFRCLCGKACCCSRRPTSSRGTASTTVTI